jgi:hypothetical protein
MASEENVYTSLGGLIARNDSKHCASKHESSRKPLPQCAHVQNAKSVFFQNAKWVVFQNAKRMFYQNAKWVFFWELHVLATVPCGAANPHIFGDSRTWHVKSNRQMEHIPISRVDPSKKLLEKRECKLWFVSWNFVTGAFYRCERKVVDLVCLGVTGEHLLRRPLLYRRVSYEPRQAIKSSRQRQRLTAGPNIQNRTEGWQSHPTPQ